MIKKRASGILLHISSLPSNYGVGDFGPSAYQFVDFLHETHQHVWQILPLSITNSVTGNSPYSSLSAFALNPVFVSPDLLVEDKLLTKEEAARYVSQSNYVDYPQMEVNKKAMLGLAFEHLKKQVKHQKSFESFKEESQNWLDDVATFLTLKELYNGNSWTQWPEEYKTRKTASLKKLAKEHANLIEWYKFIQYVLFKQWNALRKYCHQKKVVLLGDMPIYVEHDSADVWANGKFFKLNANLYPDFVAGVPPDYFSETGQRWGNPLYDWDALSKDHFKWWIARVKHGFELYDMVRIDHFRGLVNYWQIPASEKTAINGKWVDAPVDDFLHALIKAFPGLPLVAEDLGIITDQVKEVMSKFKLPGMKILLFAFGGDMATHPYLPHSFDSNCIVYTGTHDNNTARGWYENEAQLYEKLNLSKYLGDAIISPDDVHWHLIELAYSSKAKLAIIPIQDILGLGKEARMNVPGTVLGNWQWRLNPDLLTKEIKGKLASLVSESERI